MFLDYLALFLLLLSLTAVFYLFIFIHDLPHKIAQADFHGDAKLAGNRLFQGKQERQFGGG